MSKAAGLFAAVPKKHNCAQAVACGCGGEELYDELSVRGGGKAPEGMCGALYAALRLTPEPERPALRRAFAEKFGSEKCTVLKQVLHIPCADCVAFAASLIEKKSF